MAYKGRVLECLTDPGKQFFKDEFKKDNDDASLRRIEFLIIDIVRPYKIGMFFFLICILLMSAYLALNLSAMMKVKEQRAALDAEKKQLHEAMDGLEKKVIALSAGRPTLLRESTVDIEDQADVNIEAFFERLSIKAETGLIGKGEIARLLKIAATKDRAYTLKKIKSKKLYRRALSRAELAEISKGDEEQ